MIIYSIATDHMYGAMERFDLLPLVTFSASL